MGKGQAKDVHGWLVRLKVFLFSSRYHNVLCCGKGKPTWRETDVHRRLSRSLPPNA